MKRLTLLLLVLACVGICLCASEQSAKAGAEKSAKEGAEKSAKEGVEKSAKAGEGISVKAGKNDLLWDFTEKAPKSSSKDGLCYLIKCTDAVGINNGLKGIKLDSKGYCYFTKAPVAGRLKLYFGDRTTNKATSLLVYTWSGDTPRAETLIAETGELTEYGLQVVELDETQNNIYITRGGQQVETVLQKIQFKEGFDATPEPCVIIYRDQHGKELGRVVTEEGASLTEMAYREQDLPRWSEEEKYRGWFYLNGRKAKVGDKIVSNTTIQARVTPVAKAVVGSVQDYPLSSPTFYAEDQDLMSIEGRRVRLRLAGEKTVVVFHFSNGETHTKRFSGRKEVTLPTEPTLERITVYNVPAFMMPDEHGCYHVPANDAASFLLALSQANKTGNATIMLPNGVYDLGEMVLTPISGNNIAIIGESMEGTIIRNAPDYHTESINRTATLRITNGVKGTRLRDLTIENALDYYRIGSGRAVCLWDQGTQTVCRRVRLLSHQDTYYSNMQGAVKLFEDCEIHGTVDFICGDGSVYFKRCLLYCEKRNLANTGVDAITANNSVAGERGYVFDSCTIKSECPTVSLGRAWRYNPQVVFLHTVFDYSAGVFRVEDGDKTQRWSRNLMNRDAWPTFGEYNSHLPDGTVLTPERNDVTFIDTNSGNTERVLPTVLSEEEAKKIESEIQDLKM